MTDEIGIEGGAHTYRRLSVETEAGLGALFGPDEDTLQADVIELPIGDRRIRATVVDGAVQVEYID